MFNAIILGIVSTLSYISKEMIYPIIPLYLSEAGVGPAIIGLIEGVSKSLTSLIKFYSGYFSDKRQNRKKLVIIGYACNVINNIVLIITNSWFWILSSKIIERIGKGIRIAPRDAIIAESENIDKGRVFGLQRTFDKFGAAIGILISYFLITKYTNIEYKTIFIVAAFPSITGLFLLFFIKQDRVRKMVNVDLTRFNKSLKIFFIVAFISTLGNSTKSFLLLRATSIGFNSSNVILLYLITNLTTCILAYPIGKVCNELTSKKMIYLAYTLLGIIFFSFAYWNSKLIFIIIFILHGLYIALINVSSKTFIINNCPDDMKATAIGINECLIGLASLPASIIAGTLWNINPSITFYFGGLLAFIAAFIFFISQKSSSLN